MNKLKQIRVVIAIAMMLTIHVSSSAYDFETNGIYYTIIDETNNFVKVTNGESLYVGNIEIPNTVVNQNTSYTVTSIGERAFFRCTELTSVTVPNQITEIEYEAFQWSGLTSINIPNSVIKIHSGAFGNCSNLTSITIPNSVTYIGPGAFYFCSNLSEINISNSITELGGRVFTNTAWYNNHDNGILYLGNYCLGLKGKINQLDIKEGTCLIADEAFLGCDFDSVTIPNSVTLIGSEAFYNCDNITSISIPSSVEEISSSAFESCSNLINISFENPKHIGNFAFRNCPKITNIRSFSQTPQNFTENVFDSNVYTNATLIIPYKCTNLYTICSGWKYFSNIIEMEMPSIYLTIKLPESGVITHKEIYEKAAELSFKANDGWEINTVSFNDEDVTTQLDENGNFITPILTEDANLIVVFKKIPSGVDSLALTNDIKVFAKNGFIEIVGANADSVVNIYDTMGISKYIGKDNRIYLEDSGIYILTVDGHTFKFAM